MTLKQARIVLDALADREIAARRNKNVKAADEIAEARSAFRDLMVKERIREL